jgi:hypothetical protein
LTCALESQLNVDKEERIDNVYGDRGKMVQGENPRNVINIEEVVVAIKISAFYGMATSKLPGNFMWVSIWRRHGRLPFRKLMLLN